jgi:hypothetical protein
VRQLGAKTYGRTVLHVTQANAGQQVLPLQHLSDETGGFQSVTESNGQELGASRYKSCGLGRIASFFSD